MAVLLGISCFRAKKYCWRAPKADQVSIFSCQFLESNRFTAGMNICCEFHHGLISMEFGFLWYTECMLMIFILIFFFNQLIVKNKQEIEQMETTYFDPYDFSFASYL